MSPLSLRLLLLYVKVIFKKVKGFFFLLNRISYVLTTGTQRSSVSDLDRRRAEQLEAQEFLFVFALLRLPKEKIIEAVP